MVLATALCACGSQPPQTAAADRSAPLSSPDCPDLEHPPVQTGTHLIGDAEPPVPYSSTPASSGWHATGVPEPGLADEPLGDPQIVSLLEQGIVVLAHRPGAEPDDEVATRLVEQFPDRLAITAYTGEMPTAVALVTWGTIARCDRVDPAAVTEFVVERRVSPDGQH